MKAAAAISEKRAGRDTRNGAHARILPMTKSGILQVIAVSLLLLLGVLALYERGAGVSQTALCRDCNVIIIAFDALGASRVSLFGNENETTPTLDALLKKGTSFGNAVSPAPWTVPSFMSIFTGLYPSEHKVVNKFSVFTKEEQVVSNLTRLSPQVETLAEAFRASGYATAGFTGDAGVGAQFGYGKGFDVYTDEKTFGSMQNAASHALPWLLQNKDKKFFLFLHGYDDHGQSDMPTTGRFIPKNYEGLYKGTAKEQSTLREEGLAGKIKVTAADAAFWSGWYDSKIRDADDRFARFLEQYDKLGIKNKTIIVLISDHGTEAFEHGRIDHGFSLYDELERALLGFIVPGLPSRGIISDQVTTLDVAPTLVELTGIKPSPQYASQLRGKSLLSYLKTGKGEARDVFMETDYRNYTHKRGIRAADGWKYIMTMESGAEELYDLKKDPRETSNVFADNPDIATMLRGKVIAHIEATGQQMAGPWTIGCLPVYGDQCK